MAGGGSKNDFLQSCGFCSKYGVILSDIKVEMPNTVEVTKVGKKMQSDLAVQPIKVNGCISHLNYLSAMT